MDCARIITLIAIVFELKKQVKKTKTKTNVKRYRGIKLETVKISVKDLEVLSSIKRITVRDRVPLREVLTLNATTRVPGYMLFGFKYL